LNFSLAPLRERGKRERGREREKEREDENVYMQDVQ